MGSMDYTVLPATGSGDFPAFTPAEGGTQFSKPTHITVPVHRSLLAI